MQIGELSRLLGVDKNIIKKWLYLFEEYFSPAAAHPKDGQPRIFNQSDIRRLLLIGNSKDWWSEEDDKDYSNVFSQLNSSDEFDERFLYNAYLKAPLFQSLPDNPEEMATFSIALGESWTGTDLVAIAQSFKHAGDILVNQALEIQEPWKFENPILFCYRHSIELFLKMIVHPGKADHDLSSLIQVLEMQVGSKLNPEVKNILAQFAEIDPNSTTFRYGEAQKNKGFPCDDVFVNLHQLEYIMDFLTRGFLEILGRSQIY